MTDTAGDKEPEKLLDSKLDMTPNSNTSHISRADGSKASKNEFQPNIKSRCTMAHEDKNRPV
jgi:hypothetical protein